MDLTVPVHDLRSLLSAWRDLAEAPSRSWLLDGVDQTLRTPPAKLAVGLHDPGSAAKLGTGSFILWCRKSTAAGGKSGLSALMALPPRPGSHGLLAAAVAQLCSWAGGGQSGWALGGTTHPGSQEPCGVSPSSSKMVAEISLSSGAWVLSQNLGNSWDMFKIHVVFLTIRMSTKGGPDHHTAVDDGWFQQFLGTDVAACSCHCVWTKTAEMEWDLGSDGSGNYPFFGRSVHQGSRGKKIVADLFTKFSDLSLIYPEGFWKIMSLI